MIFILHGLLALGFMVFPRLLHLVLIIQPKQSVFRISSFTFSTCQAFRKPMWQPKCSTFQLWFQRAQPTRHLPNSFTIYKLKPCHFFFTKNLFLFAFVMLLLLFIFKYNSKNKSNTKKKPVCDVVSVNHWVLGQLVESHSSKILSVSDLN